MTENQAKLLAIIKRNPQKVLQNRKLFEACMKHLLRIISRAGLMPMVPNNTQKMILDAYFQQKGDGKPIRCIVLKGRQQGSSTGIAAILMIELLCRSNLTVLVASEKKGGSARNLFAKFRVFLENYPEFPTEMGIRQRCQSFLKDKQIDLYNNANVRIEGQQDVISYTNECIHISEASRFSDFQSFLGSCLQGTEELEGTSIFIESTAYGYGDGFHNEWTRAVEGKSGFIPVFAPWYIHERNTRALPTDAEELQQFESSVGRMRDRYGDEDVIQEQFGLDLNQIYWRRIRIDGTCQGSLEMFSREYPSTPDEAFLAQDTPVLHPRSLEWYRERTKPSEQLGYMLPEHTGGKREDGTQQAEFMESPQGAFESWGEPDPYKEYVIGSDHAEGTPTGDFNAGLLASRLPFEVTGKLRGNDATKLSSIEYAKQLYYVGKWYNDACILLETNGKNGGEVLTLLREWDYPNLMWENEIYRDVKSNRIGWSNQTATRKNATDLLYDSMFIDFREETAGVMKSEFAPIIPDIMTIEECQHIVWKSIGRWEAKRKGEYRSPGSSSVGCYDDLVIALICLLLAQKSLPKPKTEDEMKLEIHGPDHNMTDHIPDFIQDAYRPTIEDPKVNETAWWGYL